MYPQRAALPGEGSAVRNGATGLLAYPVALAFLDQFSLETANTGVIVRVAGILRAEVDVEAQPFMVMLALVFRYRM